MVFGANIVVVTWSELKNVIRARIRVVGSCPVGGTVPRKLRKF